MTTTRFTFRMNAGPHEIYTESFARSLVGQTPRLNLREHEDGPVLSAFDRANVVAAEVIEDGRAVLVTYDAPDSALTDALRGALLHPAGGSGFSFRPIPAEPESITCPACGRTSYHPTDVAEGYCGACHDWTGAKRGGS